MDELEAKERSDLHEHKGVAPMACSADAVKALIMCKVASDDTGDACLEPAIRRMTSMVTNPR